MLMSPVANTVTALLLEPCVVPMSTFASMKYRALVGLLLAFHVPPLKDQVLFAVLHWAVVQLAHAFAVVSQVWMPPVLVSL